MLYERLCSFSSELVGVMGFQPARSHQFVAAVGQVYGAWCRVAQDGVVDFTTRVAEAHGCFTFRSGPCAIAQRGDCTFVLVQVGLLVHPRWTRLASQVNTEWQRIGGIRGKACPTCAKLLSKWSLQGAAWIGQRLGAAAGAEV